MCINGEWQQITVDDHFPCFAGQPVFSKGNGNELWVLLLEKAWAKVHGSYYQIEGGHPEEVMHDLTGAPAELLPTADPDFWQKLQKAHKHHAILAASSVMGDENLAKVGLVEGHSYGILALFEVEDQFEDKVQLV